MTDRVLASEEEERLQRLGSMLRGIGPASESKFLRGMRQGSEGGVLVGAMLHTAARYDQGKPLTDLEKSLLQMMQGFLSDLEIAASGREYRQAVGELGRLDVISAEITSRSPSVGLTWADIRALLPEIGQEALGMANVSVVSPVALAAGQPLDSASFQAGLHEFGFGTTVFQSPPPDAPPSADVPSFQASLQFEKFFVRRVVGDAGWSRDEIYWTVAATSDKFKAPVYTSEEFGAVKKDQTRVFDAANKVVFNGRAGTHVVLGVTVWEADQSHSEWYDALHQSLTQWLETAKWQLEFAFLFVPEWAGMAFELGKLMVWLMQYLRNYDDNSCTRTIVLDRYTLVSLYERQTDVWEFDGDGHHALTVKYTGQRPVFPSGALEYRVLGADQASWTASVSLGWQSVTSPALASYAGKLHAMYTRPGDNAVMWSVLEDGAWREPQRIGNWASYHQPSLLVHNNTLYAAVVSLNGDPSISSYQDGGSWLWSGAVPVKASAGPALTRIKSGGMGFYYRSPHGAIGWSSSADGSSWSPSQDVWIGINHGSPISGTFYADNAWIAFHNAGHPGDPQNEPIVLRGGQFVLLPIGWRTPYAPAITVHGDRLWLVAPGSEGKLHCLHTSGGLWTPLQPVSVGAMPGEFALASHNGALHVMYRRPN
ncbi:hypothetical protein [Streptomyces sp. NPDC004296]|uniref:hypothetical protein n=1 Tax=Streptomyces sp. NPDC004296 TaxID=3364697 RepID=UPI0036A4F263